LVAGSIPVSRSIETGTGKRETENDGVESEAANKLPGVVSRFSFYGSNAHVAQSVEHVLGKDEVTSSILVVGSKKLKRRGDNG
jgi:hypothetical protein